MGWWLCSLSPWEDFFLSVYLYQIIALYTLPVLQFCQLYPIKAEVKKVSASGIVTKIAVVVQSLQFSSVAQSCPTLCSPMNFSPRGLPVHHQLPDCTQTHVHQVSGAIQPSHPLSSPSPPASNPSQHQGLCKWVNSSHLVAKVLEFQLQHQSFQWTPRTDLL